MATSFSRPRALFGLAALLGAAACAVDPTAPKTTSAIQAHGQRNDDRGNNGWHDGGLGRGRWRFNTQKYRDDGSRPTTGTAGVASVQAEALIGDHGVTTLEVYSFRASNLDAPAGDIDRLALRAYSPQGQLLYSRVYRDAQVRNAFVTELPGLAPGAWLQIDAQVSGLDRRRVDDVSVGPVVVRRRPDLAVTGVNAPSVVVAGAPAVITAGVAELKGDRGARTDCVLYSGWRPVDRSRGIWVDAGDAVSCAFTYTFPAAGSYEMRVVLENITPRDRDRSNNSAGLTVRVIAPAPAPAPGAPPPVTVDYSAVVRSGTFTTVDSGSANWSVAATGQLLFDTRYLSTTSGVEQSAMMSGVLSTALPLPLTRIELRQATGGLLVHGASYDNADADYPGSTCLSRGAGSGVAFYLCANPLGFTTWTYARTAGSVTYQSSNYENVWNGASYDVNTYVDNGSSNDGTPIVLGSTFGFDVRITSGSDYYVTAVTVPLGPANVSQLDPWQCQSGTIALASGGLANTSACFYSSYQFTGVAGAVQGSGVVAQPGARVIP